MKPKVYIHPSSLKNESISLPDFNNFNLWWVVIENGELIKNNKTGYYHKYVLAKDIFGRYILRKYISFPNSEWKTLYDGHIMNQEHFSHILKSVGFPVEDLI